MQGESELVVAVFVEDDEQMFVLDLDAREARWRRVGNSARPTGHFTDFTAFTSSHQLARLIFSSDLTLRKPLDRSHWFNGY